MSKFELQRVIRGAYYILGPDEAFNLTVSIIDHLEEGGKIDHDLALYALKLTLAYKQLTEV